jgi:hypothetical protein
MAKEWGAVNEIVPADRLLARAREIAEGLAKLPPLTTRYTRIALTRKLRRIIDDGVGYSLALEGINAADVARSAAPLFRHSGSAKSEQVLAACQRPSAFARVRGSILRSTPSRRMK